MLERVHECVSGDASERTEDVSLRDRPRSPGGDGDGDYEDKGEDGDNGDYGDAGELGRVWERLAAHARVEDAALKRIADLVMQRNHLKDIAQV